MPALVQQAQQAIKRGDTAEARALLRQAAAQTPNDYKVWLLLASIATTPEAALSYVERAETLAPGNATVAKAHAWATQAWATSQLPPPPPPPVAPPQTASTRPRRWLPLAIIALLVLLMGAFWLGWQSWPPSRAMLAEVIAALPAETAIPPTLNAPAATVALPTATLPQTETATAAISAEATSTLVVTQTATPEAQAALATSLAATYTPAPTQTPAPTPTIAEIPPTAEPTATSEPPPPEGSPRPAGVGATEQWIDVNLSTQTLTAYEGDSAVMTTLISSGTSSHPTVVGQFRTWLKHETQDMNGYLLGYNYYLEDVPDVMYFYQDYAIHGAYWHNNFGNPMSHGCVNVNLTDADWLFNWAPMGTFVNVHY